MRRPPIRSPKDERVGKFSGRSEQPESEERHQPKDRSPNQRSGNKRRHANRNPIVWSRKHRRPSQGCPKERTAPTLAARTLVRPKGRGPEERATSSRRPNDREAGVRRPTFLKRRNERTPEFTVVGPIIGVFRPKDRNKTRSSGRGPNFRPPWRPVFGTSGPSLAQTWGITRPPPSLAHRLGQKKATCAQRKTRIASQMGRIFAWPES